MTFTGGTVGVSVPATSANLGPGFDALGLALELRDTVHASTTRSGLSVTVHGEGEGEVPLDETHLVVRAMRATFDVMEVPQPGLELTCTNAVPHARGLGSSAAAIVAGVHLARSLVKDGRTRLADLAAFQLAASIEGHPDNVAAAWFGGLTVAWQEDGLAHAAPTHVGPGVRAVVYIPPTPLSTEVARGLLPEVVPHADAAASAGRAALLVAAMTTGWTSKLRAGTRDWLHQDYRRPAMPDSLALVDSLREAGHGAVVSGAGPSVLVLTDEAAIDDLTTRAPAGWRLRVLDIAAIGVRPC